MISSGEPGAAAEPPKVVRHVAVYKEPGRFAGWPANHGIWSWGDEILVGFSRGTYKDRGRYHNIDHDRPEEFLLRGAETAVCRGRSSRLSLPGCWPARRGTRHRSMPPEPRPGRTSDGGQGPDRLHPTGSRLHRPDGELQQRRLAVLLLVRPGHDLARAVRLPLFGQPGVMGRTDYSSTARGLHAGSHGVEGRPQGRPALLREDDRRGPELEIPRRSSAPNRWGS